MQEKKITHKKSSFISIIENPARFYKAQSRPFARLGHIPHPQALLLRVAQGVGGATGGAGAPGDTAGGAVHQVPVAGQKGLTAGRLAADDHLVDPRLHSRRTGLLGGRPAALVEEYTASSIRRYPSSVLAL